MKTDFYFNTLTEVVKLSRTWQRQDLKELTDAFQKSLDIESHRVELHYDSALNDQVDTSYERLRDWEWLLWLAADYHDCIAIEFYNTIEFTNGSTIKQVIV